MTAAEVHTRASAAVCLALMAALAAAAPARAQSIEPRLFSNVPIGVNFVITGYAHSSGDVLLDPSIPLQDASVRLHSAFVAYSRSMALAGRSAQIQALVPYAWLAGQATLGTTGATQTRDVSGFGDPSVRFAWNLAGAPALQAAAFRSYRQETVFGVSLQITAPLGQYDRDRLVNLGTNRWSFKPEIGFSKALGKMLLEATGGASVYTDNDDFFGGQHRSQAPIYSAQGHGIYVFRPGLWSALDLTYYTGGRTTLDGVEGNDLQRNWRAGLTVAFPINRRNAIKTYGSKGVSTRSGGDFVTAGIGWQYHWGGGL
jgi:Putative MetA-pathway of phenol degradation